MTVDWFARKTRSGEFGCLCFSSLLPLLLQLVTFVMMLMFSGDRMFQHFICFHTFY